MKHTLYSTKDFKFKAPFCISISSDILMFLALLVNRTTSCLKLIYKTLRSFKGVFTFKALLRRVRRK